MRGLALGILACGALGIAVSRPARLDPSTAPRPNGSPWQRLLAHSADLGPSRTRAVSLLVTLAGDPATSSARLSRWARRERLGLSWSAGAHWALLSGPPARLGPAFDTTVEDFRARGGERFYASSTPTTRPGALRGVVVGTGRISSYARPVAAYVPDGGLTPTGLVHAYDATPLVSRGFDGTGETVVFFEFTPYAPADLSAFAKKFNLPAPQLTVVGRNATGTSSDVTEADMDIETVHEIAPGARLVYYNITSGPAAASTSFAAALATSFTDAAKRFPGAIWSLSLGACEQGVSRTDLLAVNEAATSAEAGGTTVFASSGDSGGADCGQFGEDSVSAGKGVSVPAALPAVTGVGGTTLSVTTTGDYLREAAWSMPMLSLGSGGGISTDFARPAWQTGPGLNGAPGQRKVPDVSADADSLTGNAIVVDASARTGGGTSLAAPIWAGFIALIDEFLVHSGKGPIGFANPALYALAADRTLNPSPFHDVTVGGNDFYAAGPGYDPVTGLGSPDVAALAQALLARARVGK